VSDLVFHRDGMFVGDFRKAWKTAGKDAGMPDLFFHDFRRSAARNLRRARVGRSWRCFSRVRVAG
jgi:integrase